MGLQFFVSEKEGLAVVALKGRLAGEHGEELQRCMELVLGKTPAGVVLHLGEVTEVSQCAFRIFSTFFRGLKAGCHNIKISALEPGSREALLGAGLITTPELRYTLVDAVKDVGERIRAAP